MTNPRRTRPPRRRDEISMCSEITPDGRYGIVLSRGDAERWLSYEEVLLHCTATVQAAVRAEHDAAVFQQLTKALEMPLQHAGSTVQDLRDRRPPVDAQALQPLGLTPMVTIGGKPFLEVRVGGYKVGKWTPADARNHAMACLELAAAVPLDNAYFDYLTGGEEGVFPHDTARNVIGNLASYLGRHQVVEA